MYGSGLTFYPPIHISPHAGPSVPRTWVLGRLSKNANRQGGAMGLGVELTGDTK